MNTQYQITEESNKKKNKKKALVILLCLAATAILVAGSLLAYFSDIFSGSKDMTAGTLDLDGSAAFYINDSQTAASEDDLECLNPGDTIKAVINVKNEGSKSAWIQGSFNLSAEDLDGDHLGNAFKVYLGTDPSSNTGTELTPEPDSDVVSFTDDGKAVLDGSIEKEDKDIETGAIGDVTTSMIYTIVFEKTAGNELQGAEISVGYEVKGLQYRNNPEPSWADAVELVIA